MSDIQVFKGFSHVLQEVSLALVPLIILFLLFHFAFLKLPKEQIKNIFKGIVLTFFGLAFFLQGVKVGFLPVGEAMGTSLGSKSFNWILVPVGFLLGFVATFAEPAVRILKDEVERVTSGYIPQQVLLYALSFGVGLAVAASMVRILLGIPLWYFIIPGYLLAIFMLPFSTSTFVAIAFDSGGVATGPMIVTFVMAMAIGVANSIDGRDPLLTGFGLVALVALAPILSVLTLGLLYRRKESENERRLGA